MIILIYFQYLTQLTYFQFQFNLFFIIINFIFFYLSAHSHNNLIMQLDHMFGSQKQQPIQMSKDSLNKYKKKVQKKQKPQKYQKDSTQKSSKNQFLKYFLDTTNVFFQDRQTLKQLQQVNTQIKIFAPIWVILALVYFVVSRIRPFQGMCPPNATCKVFIRCNPGYELAQNGRHCNVKASIIQQIEKVCKFEILNLKHEFGDADCMDNITIVEPPFKYVNQLTSSITKTLDPHLTIEIQRRISDFLNNATNQATYDFSVISGKVIPLSKKHSFSCWLALSSKTTQFKVVGIIFVLLNILSIWYYVVYKRQQRIKSIYEYLKNKVIQDTKVNITLLSDEMKSLFGNLDENIWIKIDEQRKKDGKIGYFEDQFLYWKLL